MMFEPPMTQDRTGNKCVVIVAGEASGDRHGAKLVRAMLAADPSLSFRGIGGPAMRNSGVRTDFDAARLAVVGITEVLSRLPAIVAALRLVKNLLRRLKPSLLVLIDFPEFNLKIAAAAKRFGIPVLYYISPQIWAWRPGRVKRIARCVDRMAVILPFEEAFYRQHRVNATFVGHPLLDDPSASAQNGSPDRRTAGADRLIALLPGSRAVEIKRHLPPMLGAASILQRRQPELHFRLSRAAGLDEEMFNRLLERSPTPRNLSIEDGGMAQLLAACDLAVAVSGTVTLQSALHGVPMIVIYRVSRLSYWIGRALIRVPYIGLVNLVAGRQLAPELIQNDVSASRIAGEVEKLLSDPAALLENRRQLIRLGRLLGGGGASARVADIAISMLE
jgi:lipid-A-disaccharide synthase